MGGGRGKIGAARAVDRHLMAPQTQFPGDDPESHRDAVDFRREGFGYDGKSHGAMDFPGPIDARGARQDRVGIVTIPRYSQLIENLPSHPELCAPSPRIKRLVARTSPGCGGPALGTASGAWAWGDQPWLRRTNGGGASLGWIGRGWGTRGRGSRRWAAGSWACRGRDCLLRGDGRRGLAALSPAGSPSDGGLTGDADARVRTWGFFDVQPDDMTALVEADDFGVTAPAKERAEQHSRLLEAARFAIRGSGPRWAGTGLPAP